jgi:hypothetical protein
MRNLVGKEVKGVGVMKDEELKLEKIEVSHTLGFSWIWKVREKVWW